MLWKDQNEDRPQKDGGCTWKSIRIHVNPSVAFQANHLLGVSPVHGSASSSPPTLLAFLPMLKHAKLPTSGSLSTYFLCQNCSFLLSWLINPSQFSEFQVSVKSPKRTCPLEIITTPPTPEPPPITFQLCYKTNNLYFKVFPEDKL